ncbi:MAG: P1 family peptidase, partial [Nocardioides sp.]
TGVRLDRGQRPDGVASAVGRGLDDLFEATVDGAEEAVLNSMLAAPTVVGRDGNHSEGLVLPEGWR